MKNLKSLVFTNDVYDALKFIQMGLLPGLATFVSGVFPVWGLPHAEAISFTISALATLVGSCLLYSNKNYKSEKDEEAEYVEAVDEAEENTKG